MTLLPRDPRFVDSPEFPRAITFDDVLLVPQYSSILPEEADVGTHLTPRIRLNVPLLSAPMDTVTESALAIALAQEGGIGIIHKNLAIDVQCREVRKVKRSESGVILDPVTLQPDDPVARAREVMSLHNISGVPVVEKDGRIVGILTRRDLKFLEREDLKIRDVMTSDNLVTGPPGTTLDEAERTLNRARVEKLLLVDKQNKLAGLITMRDIDRSRDYQQSCKDDRGRLRVGAAVGVRDYERVEALIQHGVDVIVVDTAHGHTENVIATVRELKKRHDIDVIAGNVATAEATETLIDAGADAVKVGIGPGSICTTRVVSGVGVPQLTAILDCCRVATPKGIPIIADGGIRRSGDIVKALAAGASSVMMGSLFAGLEEAPGESITWRGRRFKEYRGMGSLGAMVKGSADRYGQKAGAPRGKLVPEGVEARIPYRGPLSDFVYQLVGGLRAGMGYCGAATIDELQKKATFCRVTSAGVVESHPHDVIITKESPNYEIDYTTEQ
ncbi:MAG: IMP dehydrogenase [Phycisphaerae bacterium]|nr:IMP dehydrogenase [Phycisphaerae bacterium]